MNVLAIDTATETCGVGLLLEGKRWFESARKAGLTHAEVVLEEVHRILFQAKIAAKSLDLVVCAQGPGSFTGLRIGMATAKGIAAGADLPLVSVPTLDAMAYGLEWASEYIVPIIDAKKGRFYAAVYKHGEKQCGPFDTELHAVETMLKGFGEVLLTGPGTETADSLSKASLRISVDKRVYAWNRSYVELGITKFRRSGADGPDAGPVYLRKSDAELMLDRGARHA